MVNYYGNFMECFHELRHPLDNLLKKEVKWEWLASHIDAFEKIKVTLMSNLLLTHYYPDQELIVAADASKSGLGAVLLHRFRDRTEKAVIHASRSLNPAEQKYSQIEKEALALTFALKKFHYYVYGRRFTLQTDHQPLVTIFGNKKGASAHVANRLQRWAIFMLAYDFKIEYTLMLYRD